MIADDIIKIPQTMQERGLPEESDFEVEFADGSTRNEADTSWTLISERQIVEYFGSKKAVMACRFPVKRLRIRLAGMEAAVEVPEGARAYQAIRAEALLLPENKRKYRVIGRSVGYVVDGVVVEERYIDAVQNVVAGMRK